jgi:hypothetical protein
MAQEIDLKVLPAAAKDALSISLGAAWKSFDAAIKPMETIPAMMNTAKQMITLPEGTAGGLKEKAEALAGVWMDKGMSLVNDCKTTGEKFTEGK